jgi:carboxyl-terminal processing protease
MGEGLAIGLNGAAGSTVVGSSMGRLLGAIVKVDLPMSCLSISYANEKLWHVDGRPREAFLPDVLLEAADTPVDGGQKPVERAIAIASQSDRQKP